jgi:hypothetical protein
MQPTAKSSLRLPPLAQIVCPPLSAPTAAYNCSSSSAPASVGTVCAAACPAPQVLSGSAARACQADGTWSGEDAACRCPAAADGSAAYFGAGCSAAAPLAYKVSAALEAAATTVLGRADVAAVAVPSAADVLNGAAGTGLTMAAYR